MLALRKAAIDDLVEITEIYNEAIINTTATFDTQPKTLAEQKTWFLSHQPNYPILVVEQDNLIVGWASLSKWSDRNAYSGTAEVSLYVRKEYRSKGIGRQLLKSLMEEGKNIGPTQLSRRLSGTTRQALTFLNQKTSKELEL